MTTTFEDRTRASLILAAGDPHNERARAAFVACYGDLIRGWCRRKGLQGADQDDVAQTVLRRIFERLPAFSYDPSKRFRGLLYAAVGRAVVDLYRERKRRPGGRGSGDSGVLSRLHAVPDPDAVEDLVGELSEQMERNQRVNDACERVRARVEPHTWQAFWLTVVEGLTGPEAAARLAMNKTAVLVCKHRVIKMIREEVGVAAGGEGSAAPTAKDR
jgi:RNA polymerase sigma-70 factor (ECF subfamily)